MEHSSKEILVAHGVKVKIAKDCNTSCNSVKYALRGYTDSSLAMLIRKRAIDFYGGAYAKK